MSVAPVHSDRLLKLARRLVTIPAVLLGGVVWIAALPLSLPIALVVDLFARRRLLATRLVLFAAVYLACGIAGILASTGLWLAERAWPGFRGARADAAQYALQAWWTRSLFASAARIFALDLQVAAPPELRDAPVLVFIRHASIVDVLLPSVLLTNRLGYRLRYVLKRELLWDPCLDLNGNRLPNYFVWRSAPDSRPEIEALRSLARGMGGREGLVIYPEGTRFTPAKRARILEKLESSGDGVLFERAKALERVLPPKLGGPLALLEETPQADVLFVGHVGLDGLATLRDVWRGGLVGRRIRVRLWCVPRRAVPEGAEGRAAWLFGEWARMDAWVRQSL